MILWEDFANEKNETIKYECYFVNFLYNYGNELLICCSGQAQLQKAKGESVKPTKFGDIIVLPWGTVTINFRSI